MAGFLSGWSSGHGLLTDGRIQDRLRNVDGHPAGLAVEAMVFKVLTPNNYALITLTQVPLAGSRLQILNDVYLHNQSARLAAETLISNLQI